MIKVMVTGVGSEGAYGVIKSLRDYYKNRIYIIGLDTNINCANKKFVDKFIVSLKRTDNKYYDYILDNLKKNEIDIFWPIPTEELNFFAENKADLERRTNSKVMIGDIKSIIISNNKATLYDYFQDIIPDYIPKYRICNNLDQIERAVFELGYPNKRVCFKKVTGSGSRGFRVLFSEHDEYNSLMNEYPSQTVCRWDSLKDILKDKVDLPNIMIMEYLPKSEYDVDIICKDGKSYCIIPRLNYKMHFGMSLVTKTCFNKEITDISKLIVEKLNLSYIVSLTFKMDEYNKLKLLEINPRVPGTIIATTYSGVNYPKLAIDLLLNKYSNEEVKINWNKTIIRYWEDIVINEGDYYER